MSFEEKRRRPTGPGFGVLLAALLISTGTGTCLDVSCSELDPACSPGAAGLFLVATFPVQLRLPDTGQAGCYSDSSAVACGTIAPGQPFYGQDGHFLDSPRAPGLTANGDATVIDIHTGLQWTACSIQSTGAGLLTGAGCDNGAATPPGLLTRANGITVCSNLSLAGHSDWRLPHVNELGTILDLDRPTRVDPALFPNTSTSPYLAETLNPDLPSTSYRVSFASGGIVQSSTGVSARGRCVRGPALNFGDYAFPAPGVALDTSTGLYWQQCAAASSGGACNANPTGHTWQQALAYCASLDFAGVTDWRLPNLLEMHSLMSHGTTGITIDPAVFSNTSGEYWTATTSPADESLATIGDFTFRTVDYKSKSTVQSVRCVRD